VELTRSTQMSLVDRMTAFIDTGGLFKRGKRVSKTHMKDRAIRMLGGMEPSALGKGIGQVGLTDIPKFGFLKTAQDVEKNSSVMIMYRSIQDTMDKMLKFGDDGISLRALESAGGSEEMMRVIPKLLVQND